MVRKARVVATIPDKNILRFVGRGQVCFNPNFLISLSANAIMTALPLLSTSIVRAIDMFIHTRRLQPRAAILLKSLNPGLELGLLQCEVVDRASTGNAHTWVAGTASVQQRAANAAEAVLHVVPRGDGRLLAETGQLVLAADVLEVRVFDYKI